MTTPDRGPLGGAAEAAEATEADVAEQHIPVGDTDDDDAWRDAQRVSEDRDWQANEADLIEQSIDVPDDDADVDR